LGYLFLISNSLFQVFSSILKLLHHTFIIEIFLFLSSFSIWFNTFTCFTSRVKSSSISKGTWGSVREGSTSAFCSSSRYRTHHEFWSNTGEILTYTLHVTFLIIIRKIYKQFFFLKNKCIRKISLKFLMKFWQSFSYNGKSKVID